MAAPQRLQKLLARAGVASRRAAEELILAGRVTLNGERITTLGTKADPEADQIRVDGRQLQPAAPPRVFALHKPRGVVTTLDDPEGRPTIRDHLPRAGVRLFPIGRLDFHSEGLLLLTNDGEIADRVLRPAAGILKTYHVKVRGVPGANALERLGRGLPLEGRKTLPARIAPLSTTPQGNSLWIEVILQEGRRNQIRRLFQMLGHPVQKLRRVQVGAIALGSLKPGECRELTQAEVGSLLRGDSPAPRRRRAAARPRRGRGAAAPPPNGHRTSSARPAAEPVFRPAEKSRRTRKR